MTADPTLSRAAIHALDEFQDYLDFLSWPDGRDPLAARDFLAGVAGYANSLAGLPIQAEMEDRLAAMTAERDAARAELWRLEWVESYDDHRAHCPACWEYRHHGHARDCTLAAALAGAATTGPEKGGE